MNEAIKKISKNLDQLELHYEYTENSNGIILNLLSEELGISIRYLIDLDENKDKSYTLTIITSDVLRVKNEYKVLKVINEINYKTNFIVYCIDEDKDLRVKFNTFDTIEIIADNCIGFLREVINNIESNYDKIMKANWSE